MMTTAVLTKLVNEGGVPRNATRDDLCELWKWHSVAADRCRDPKAVKFHRLWEYTCWDLVLSCNKVFGAM